MTPIAPRPLPEPARAGSAAADDLEIVGWQWLTTSRIRVRLPKDAERGAWRPLYAKRYRFGG